MKQSVETIKQLVVFLLLHKTLFSKRFELNQLWIQTKSELTNLNYPRTHPTNTISLQDFESSKRFFNNNDGDHYWIILVLDHISQISTFKAEVGLGWLVRLSRLYYHHLPRVLIRLGGGTPPS